MKKPLSVALVSLTLVATASVAHAEPGPSSPNVPSRTEAAEKFRSARDAYARGEFVVAAQGFEAAGRIAPHAATFVNAAEAWERAGDAVKSAIACDRVLALSGAEAKYREAAEAILHRVGARVGTIEVAGATDRVVVVDGVEVAVPGKVRVAPGAHVVVTVDAAGRKSESIFVAAGRIHSFDVRSAEPVREVAPAAIASKEEHEDVAPAREPLRATKGGPPVLSWVAWGAGLASAGVATYFGVRTLDSQRTFEGAPTIENRDAFYTDRTMTNVSIACAAGFATIGVVVWILSPRRNVEAPVTNASHARWPAITF